MRNRRVRARLAWWGMVLALVSGSVAITAASAVYFGEELAPFMLEKLQLPLPDEDMWLLALRAHVLAAAVSLPACLLLSSMFVLRRLPRLHRWLGRATAPIVLFVLVPSGFYLSLFAKGGLPSTAGFMLSGTIVAVAMIQGIRAARARRFPEHRRLVLHVLAQLGVAVVSRAMLFAFDVVAADEITAYLVSLWLPVLGAVAAVELVAPRTRPSLSSLSSWRTHEAPADARRLDARPHRVRRALGS